MISRFFAASLLLCLVAFPALVHAQNAVGINTDSPDASAVLDVSATDRGVLLPRMTTAQRTAIGSPAEGLLVYDTEANSLYVYNGTAWQAVSSPWSSNGNYVFNTTDSIVLNEDTAAYRLDVRDYSASTNQVSTISLWQAGSGYVMGNTSGQDLSNCEAGIDPTVYNPAGNIDVKLVIRITNTTAANNNFQLRTHDGTTQTFPIVSTDAWTFAATQTGFVAVSPWKNWAAGTNFAELHLFGWVSSGSTTFNSAYLLVRPHQP